MESDKLLIRILVNFAEYSSLKSEVSSCKNQLESVKKDLKKTSAENSDLKEQLDRSKKEKEDYKKRKTAGPTADGTALAGNGTYNYGPLLNQGLPPKPPLIEPFDAPQVGANYAEDADAASVFPTSTTASNHSLSNAAHTESESDSESTPRAAQQHAPSTSSKTAASGIVWKKHGVHYEKLLENLNRIGTVNNYNIFKYKYYSFDLGQLVPFLFKETKLPPDPSANLKKFLEVLTRNDLDRFILNGEAANHFNWWYIGFR
jgi:hypothetical protein